MLVGCLVGCLISAQTTQMSDNKVELEFDDEQQPPSPPPLQEVASMQQGSSVQSSIILQDILERLSVVESHVAEKQSSAAEIALMLESRIESLLSSNFVDGIKLEMIQTLASVIDTSIDSEMERRRREIFDNLKEDMNSLNLGMSAGPSR